MKRLIDKIKNYRPAKHICFLYFFVPLFVCALSKIDRENDIWFLLNHGKYVLEHGFPTIEPFSMHQGFSFVMQQWLSAVIFYIIYDFFGKYGLLILVNLVNILILYFLYKLCMKLSDNRFRLSIIITCITDLLLLQSFMVPRPQIFTYLILIIILYIMECFYNNKNSKLIYFLPLISWLQINLHASMWFMIFLFILPYIVHFIITKIKDKQDNRIFKLLLIIGVMLLVGIINPYGIKAITYVFTSYGNYYINHSVIEMFSPVCANGKLSIYFYCTYITIFIVIAIYIMHKKGQLQLRHMLLLMGVIFLAITAIRNYALLVIGAIPFLASYMKDLFPKKKETKIVMSKKSKITYIGAIIFLLIYTIGVISIKKVSFTNELEKGIDVLLKNNKAEDIVLYTNYNDGSYAEYRGLKPYIDTRAEVFLKSNNKKEDIMKEYYFISNGVMDDKEFVNKYHFTHLIVSKTDNLYDYLSKDKSYKVIYKGKKYKIFEKVN